MGERPDWLIEGADAVLLRLVRNSDEATIEHVTVDRVLKRDVVLSNGKRLNADRLRIDNGEWETSTDLLRPDDPKVTTAMIANKRSKYRHAVNRAFSEWSRSNKNSIEDLITAAISLRDWEESL